MAQPSNNGVNAIKFLRTVLPCVAPRIRRLFIISSTFDHIQLFSFSSSLYSGRRRHYSLIRCYTVQYSYLPIFFPFFVKIKLSYIVSYRCVEVLYVCGFCHQRILSVLSSNNRVCATCAHIVHVQQVLDAVVFSTWLDLVGFGTVRPNYIYIKHCLLYWEIQLIIYNTTFKVYTARFTLMTMKISSVGRILFVTLKIN